MALTNGQARRILAEWHGGQWSAVYSVMSSGKMDRRMDAIDELSADLDRHTPAKLDSTEHRELTAVIGWLSEVLHDMDRDEWIRAWDETPA